MKTLLYFPEYPLQNVAVLKRIPVFDTGQGRFGRCKSIGDFIQLDFDVQVDLSDCGIEIYTVANFFQLRSRIRCAIRQSSRRAYINRVAPLAIRHKSQSAFVTYLRRRYRRTDSPTLC